jgi:hypothetical protein
MNESYDKYSEILRGLQIFPLPIWEVYMDKFKENVRTVRKFDILKSTEIVS